MAKKSNSALHDLFVAVRRVVVLVVTAFGLAMQWPLPVVAIRVAVLWAVLVVLSGFAEIMFQYLSHRALLQQHAAAVGDQANGASRS
ncbi:MAG: hypothetical protein IPH10_00880 [bacterium]|nr:hypothetical protein [bacterium]